MSSQLVRIGATCVAIVLGAVVVGSQLSTSDKLLAPKATEEDKAGAIGSADPEEAETRSEAEEGAAESVEQSADEEDADADEEAAEGDIVSDALEDSEVTDGEQVAEGEDASESENDATEDGDGGGDASADSRGPSGVEGGERISNDNGFSLIGGNR